MVIKAKKFIYETRFNGLPKESDLKLVEEDLPALKNGEFLAEAVYLSVDPYQRAHGGSLKIGSTMIGIQVAKIIDSKNPKYQVGKHVVGNFGWTTHSIQTGENEEGAFKTQVVPDPVDFPASLYLGVLGMPGNTSYFGFLELCQPKEGETVVVSGAAGAVGSHVGQIAKIKGCRVVGIAGSEEKGKWLVDELKFDAFVNYKKDDWREQLKNATPNGVDCYFDNVGGEIASFVMSLMNDFGRVSCCGSISSYNNSEPDTAPIVQPWVVMKQLKVEGFIVLRWLSRWQEGIKQNLKWVKEGKLKYQETVTNGFENMPKAFIDMLKGGNVGKAVVKV